MQDDEPELAGYVPLDRTRPLRSARTLAVMRFIVIVGILGFILPGVVTTISVAANSARIACQRWVAYADPSAPGSQASFQLWGNGGTGWACYTRGAFGGDHFVSFLGFIPGAPVFPRTGTQNS